MSLVLNSGNLYPEGLAQDILDEMRIDYEAAKNGRTEEERHEAALLELMLFEPQIRPEELSKIAVPTLVIAGDRDMIRPEHTRLIANSIPGAKLRILPGTHGLLLESPDAFNRAVGAFYDSFVR